MIYWDFKDLIRRTAADNVSGHKAFHIAKNPKYDGYQRRLASMIYNFFFEKQLGCRSSRYATDMWIEWRMKDLDFHCLLFIFIVNMHGLFL